MILDLGLPQRPGLEVLQQWRSHDRNMPVLILTARDSWQERVEGLRQGADDYLGKPFHPEELLARLEALCRRFYGQTTQQIQIDDLTLDLQQQQLIRHGEKPITLTAIEFRLLRFLILNPDKILAKSTINSHLYDETQEHDSNVIEVYIRRLRQKLGRERISTLRGQGYRFNSQTDS